MCSETFESSYLENLGNSTFSTKPLPVEAQFSPVYGMVAEDYNADGNLDIVLVGNSYATEVSTGRYDASIGLYLQGNGNGGFNSVNVRKSGFMVDNDAKGLSKLILGDGREIILAGVNNGKLKDHVASGVRKYYKAAVEDAYAIVRLTNGKFFKHEFFYGSTYLSQSSRTFVLSSNVKDIEVYSFSGKKK